MAEHIQGYINVIQDEISIKIINFAKEPKTTEEIINEIWRFLRAKYPALYDDKLRVSSVVASKLGILEKINAISYTDGHWQTTKAFTDILVKYFGM